MAAIRPVKRNYWKNSEKFIKYSAEYRNKNREIILPKRRAWYQENKERLRLECKEYNIINKEKLGWEPKTEFKDMIAFMVKEDIRRLSHDLR